MQRPDFILLYVKSPQTSRVFYSWLLGVQPVEASPNFALFALPTGLKIGMWARDKVEPPVENVGGAEIVFTAADAGEVEQVHADWHARGLTIAQAPTAMEFGTTFTALDPDGYRLRVFAPAPVPELVLETVDA